MDTPFHYHNCSINIQKAYCCAELSDQGLSNCWSGRTSWGSMYWETWSLTAESIVTPDALIRWYQDNALFNSVRTLLLSSNDFEVIFHIIWRKDFENCLCLPVFVLVVAAGTTLGPSIETRAISIPISPNTIKRVPKCRLCLRQKYIMNYRHTRINELQTWNLYSCFLLTSPFQTFKEKI